MSELYTGRTWSVPLDPNVKLLTSNDRLTQWAHARRVSELREIGGWLAIKHRLPRGIQYAHILAFIMVTDNRRYDPANWHPTAKALVDGLVDAKVFPDDNLRHILGPDPRVSLMQRQRGFLLYIREMTHMPEESRG